MTFDYRTDFYSLGIKKHSKFIEFACHDRHLPGVNHDYPFKHYSEYISGCTITMVTTIVTVEL